MKKLMLIPFALLMVQTALAHVTDVKVEEFGAAIKISYIETENKLTFTEYIRKADIVTVSLLGRDRNSPFVRIVRKGHYPENARGTDYDFDRDQWKEAEKMVSEIVAIVYGK